MTKSSENVRRMVLCAMFTALVAVCSQIAVPMPWGVPINLALFAVYMAGTMLGPVWGTASQVVFIALAAIGVPVLANFQGGPSAIFGKTGGYAIGYILTALLTALLTKALGRKFWSLCVAMVVGCAACYVLGTIWFMILTGADLVSALGWCVLPYLPG
ncbi:MAG: biotin transporter BioY, partial [Gemmiger formicilis]|nr:biotin transporter BioY [Gemmiger formicilis]MDD6524022.1 biotin transporter BioY [Gemmiger formicilis]